MDREQIMMRATGTVIRDQIAKAISSVEATLEERLERLQERSPERFEELAKQIEALRSRPVSIVNHVAVPEVRNEVNAPAVHVHNGVETPKVHVNNEVKTPEVHVTVDLKPVADAILHMAKAQQALNNTVARGLEESVRVHAKVLGGKPQPIKLSPHFDAPAPARVEFKPNIVVPEARSPDVNVVNEVKTPDVKITNEVKTPNVKIFNRPGQPDVKVNVDMRPVAAAIAKSLGKEIRVTHAVESPGVHVDMTPVANAIEGLVDGFNQSLTAALKGIEASFRQLAAAINKQPAVEVRPVLNLPAPEITVNVPERVKRRLVIEHDDGTRSTVAEE